MAAKDPEIRRLAARVAANSRHAAVPYPHRPEVPARLRSRYEREVDRDGRLPEDVRRRRAVSAWRRDVAFKALRAAREGDS